MTDLKSRLKQSDILVTPGIYDSLTALLAEDAGMEALFLSGSAVAYSQLGRPDIGLVTMSEMVDTCARICDRVNIPVLVDVDSGFGNAAHAGRTIRALELAGATAVQMEDQVPINPANDLKGRPLVAPRVMADKIKAMADDRRRSATLISARSDAPFSEPMDRVLERMALYREAGADILFAEGLKTEVDVKAVVEVAGDVPVLYNLLRSNGELSSAAQLEQIGVSIALFPGHVVLPSVATIREALVNLKENPALLEDGFPISPEDFNAILGTPDLLARFKDYS